VVDAVTRLKTPYPLLRGMTLLFLLETRCYSHADSRDRGLINGVTTLEMDNGLTKVILRVDHISYAELLICWFAGWCSRGLAR
jgi:hypothetical protein